jgi:hypothetical protein
MAWDGIIAVAHQELQAYRRARGLPAWRFGEPWLERNEADASNPRHCIFCLTEDGEPVPATAVVRDHPSCAAHAEREASFAPPEPVLDRCCCGKVFRHRGRCTGSGGRKLGAKNRNRRSP